MKTQRKNRLLVFLLMLLCLSLDAQIHFTRNNNIVVLNLNGDTLKNPWVGGFNSVQFSEIDLNLDGIKDLFVFGRSGNRISPFINLGIPNTTTYQYAPEYIADFPNNLHDWVLLRDYNCDGKMDIFTYSVGGMAVYKNTSNTSLSFSLVTNLVYSNFQPNYINLYVSSTDIPAIDDIDGDGDLDVLTFSILGSNVEYHRNLSIENYGTCDSLVFEVRNRCWGYFSENFNGNTVTMFDTCSSNVTNPERINNNGKHSGSTLLTFDVDSNNTKDLVLGDVSYDNFILLTNNDTSTNFTSSSITVQDTAFPANNVNSIATHLPLFPAGFYLDVNNDGIKDLIASPNCYVGCKNSNNVWYYKNTNANNKPNFNLVTTGFLQEGMIDVGEGSHPVFFDYNADGLLDIVVGNHYEFDLTTSTGYKSSLYLYKNIGTATTPAYQLITDDYANISTINLDISSNLPAKRLIPTFGDIDGDGDKDMIIGDFNGKLHLFTNSGGVGNSAVFNLTTPNYANIDIGNFASPQLIDINNDLLLDLVIGMRNGFVSYYENTGTATSPIFTLITNTFGNIKTRHFNEYNGNSTPFVFKDNGSTKILSGATNGWIYEYSNIDGNLSGTFTLVDSMFLNIHEGTNSFVNVADITNDGKLDMVLGNYAGGVSYYKGDVVLATTVINKKHLNKIRLYPNPSKDKVVIDLNNNSLENATIKVFDIIGKPVFQRKITQQKITLNFQLLTRGIYLIKFSNNYGSKILKVVKD